MDELTLDGNSIAGLLQQVFALEMTTAIGTCAACGGTAPLGAVRVFRGAGIVLRCPQCGNALAKVVESERRVWIDLRGTQTIEMVL